MDLRTSSNGLKHYATADSASLHDSRKKAECVSAAA
jgi:hypothetical protein